MQQPQLQSEERPIRILLIDDDDVMHILVGKLLKRLQLRSELSWIGSSDLALSSMHSGDYDVCLLDYNIDHQDGLEILEQYREQGGDLPIIFLTGDVRQEIDERALVLGANDYLIKDEMSERSLSRSIRYAMQNMELLNKVRASNKRYQADLEAAAQVQRAVLPQADLAIADYEFAWEYKPSVKVAGDLLNFFVIDDQHLGAYIIDVSGHGVPAAMFAVQLSRVLMPGTTYGEGLHQIVPEDFLDPSMLVGKLNVLFPMKKPDLKYFTIIYAVIHRQSGEIRFAGAGSPAPLKISPSGSVEQIACSGIPIGMFTDSEYDEVRVQLDVGERLVLISDGINEAMNEHEELLGWDRITDSLSMYQDSVHKQSQLLLDTVHKWSDASLEQDDCSLIVLERK